MRSVMEAALLQTWHRKDFLKEPRLRADSSSDPEMGNALKK